MSGLVEGVRSAWDDGSVKHTHERQILSETVMIVRLSPPRSLADRLSTGKHHQDCCSPVILEEPVAKRSRIAIGESMKKVQIDSTE